MPQISRIVFLHEGHFSQTYYEMFGIELLEKNGFQVEVWNFLPFLKGADFQRITPPDPIVWSGYHLFPDRSMAIEALSALTASDMVICGLHYTLETYTFYRMLSKKKTIYCSNLAMALPTGTLSNTRQIKKKIQRINVYRIFSRLFQMIPFKMLGVKPADIVLAMGEKFFRHGYPMNEKSEILWVHFHDYDNYLAIRDVKANEDEKLGVFIDEYLPFHPDHVDMGLPSVEAGEYYRLLCDFFNFLEEKYGVHITIAAHPRSKYDEMPDLFGGRPVIRGKTVELVRNAAFVMLHQSMALNYAVLFRKPIILITTDQQSQFMSEDPSMEWLGSFFGTSVHNLNRSLNIDLSAELTINEEAYKLYQNDYIKKTGSPELPFWQIVADRIKKIQ